MKITVAGGKRYGYVDAAKSTLLNDIIFRDSAFNERQFNDYFRFDLKINWKYNAAKVTHEIGIDLVNLTGQKNLLGLAYAPSLDPTVTSSPGYEPTTEKTQLGFLPLFYYKIDFSINKKK